MQEVMNAAKPLRVCHVVVSLERLGGHSIAATRLIEAFAGEPEAGIEAELLPTNPRLPAPFSLLLKVKYLRTIVNTVVYLLSLFIKLPRYDVVQVYAASYFSFVITPAPAVLIAKLYGKPVILHYHSGEAEDHLRRWPLTTRLVLRLADEIVVPSEFLVDIFARFGFRARAIFNLVDFSRCRFRERNPLRPVFITNRLLEPPYNIGCALRAFALIQQRYPEARLTVASHGWLRPQLEELARALGLRNTVFTGRIPFHEMPAVYDAHDIYLNPADVDNMPGSITESFACGLAVVTTDAGGIPYILTHEETGLMVSINDHEAMAASAIRLIENQGLASRIIRNSHEKCLNYSWSQVSPNWIELYRKLAKSARRRQPIFFSPLIALCARLGQRTIENPEHKEPR
jgi:glycosyltransferase involved in cell wall biosynthesis